MSGGKITEIRKGDRYFLPAFFKFTKTVFPSADFGTWIRLGYWDGVYTPHALVSGKKIIANVGATPLEIFINGERRRGVQIGTVGTLPEERSRGLSRQLMEHVIRKYERESDIFFLFANETVLDFYPKFGFKRSYESIYRYFVQKGNSGKHLNKLDLAKKGDRYLIDHMLKTRSPLTRLFGAEDYGSITWWHLINVYGKDIYYWEDKDLLIIMYAVENTLKLIDLISTVPQAPEPLINEIAGFGNTSSLLFHFPPAIIPFPYDKMEPDEEPMLFVRGNFNPAPGFKFPVTAQT
jgi:GNAT superfamily N-acetyltransferase